MLFENVKSYHVAILTACNLVSFCLFTLFLLIIKHQQIIASENQPVRWTTPLGLPVVQPYRKLGRHLVSFNLENFGFLVPYRTDQKLIISFYMQVKTSLQVLTLQRESEKVFLPNVSTFNLSRLLLLCLITFKCYFDQERNF